MFYVNRAIYMVIVEGNINQQEYYIETKADK